MTFQKAKPQQAKVKIGFYGKQGSGKTASSLLLAEGLAKTENKRIAYIDTEHGTDFYALPVTQRKWHPTAFDFDAIYSRSLADAIEAVKTLDTKTYGVLVIDSMSHLWEGAIAAYTGRKTSIGGIPIQAWGALKKPYKDMLGICLNLPIHLILCGRQSPVLEKDEDTGEIGIVGTKMKAEGETPYEPHILVRMYQATQNGDGFVRGQCVAYFEKDRTGLFTGKSVVEPTFETFKPILDLLGGEQAQQEFDTSEQDATLIKDPAEAEMEKMNLSLSIKDDFQARITACKTIDELLVTWNDLLSKEGNRYRYKTKLLTEHLDFLTQLKDEKKQIIMNKLV